MDYDVIHKYLKLAKEQIDKELLDLEIHGDNHIIDERSISIAIVTMMAKDDGVEL